MNGSYGKIFAFVPRPIFRVLKYSLSLVVDSLPSFAKYKWMDKTNACDFSPFSFRSDGSDGTLNGY